MRTLVALLSIAACVCAQGPSKSGCFPIPSNMQEYWRGADLSEADQTLVSNAIEADLMDLEKDCEDKYKSKADSVDLAGASLGKLGKGVFVRMSGSCMCGATGNCPIYVYVREKDLFRHVLADDDQRPMGWTFAVVNSKTAIPDIVLASNGGGGTANLSLFRYVGSKYVLRAFETLEEKGGGASGGSFDPAAVVVKSCHIVK